VKIVLKERLKTHKGITLIALVITIIVLLILAGVAIATLTGDNGIIAKAQQAKMQNDKANEKEQIDLAVLASKINNDASIDKKTLRKELDGISNLIESGIPTSDEYSFPLILVGKTGTEYEIDEDANVSEKIDYSEVVVPTITATGNLANKPNIKEVREGNIPIPEGYNYIKGDKIGGAVITDAASGEEKVGNEFVWVPVDTLSDMAVPTTGKDANNFLNYRGVLYNWEKDNTGKTQYDWSADSTSFREPANLDSKYDSTNMMQNWNSTLYQEEYNKMVKSVSEYGGFYIGRYEMSINATSKNAESKYGATSANASDTDTNQWYGLYNRAKTYAPEKNSDNTENASQKVVSSMIWGSQYDAMLKWMKGNKINATSSSPTDLSIGTTSKNTTRVTGGANNGQTVSKDKLSNIYDLLGNSYEWTQEANNTDNRVSRGGYYDFSYAPNVRSNGDPTYTGSVFGSRLTLYIK
jgi:type II secretory pathway pseudopilin PulG